MRRLTLTERTGAIVLYFSLLTTLLGLSTIVLGWHLPPPRDLALLALIGILGGIGQILLTQSFRYADASVIAPFEYTTMIWALLFGWFAFGEMPTAAVLVGAATSPRPDCSSSGASAASGSCAARRSRRIHSARREARGGPSSGIPPPPCRERRLQREKARAGGRRA